MRHFPLRSHKQAEPAARAMQAAHRQGKAWEMAEKLFANPRKLSPDDMAGYAEELGLDVARFKADLDSPDVALEVKRDSEAGTAARVSGTPTIFVNCVPYRGRRDVEGFKREVDAQIAKADALLAAGTPREKLYETLCKATE